jgi:hypothetical protein
MKITPGVSGDRLLLQVVALVDTTNFCSYEDTGCAEFCCNGVILLSLLYLYSLPVHPAVLQKNFIPIDVSRFYPLFLCEDLKSRFEFRFVVD